MGKFNVTIGVRTAKDSKVARRDVKAAVEAALEGKTLSVEKKGEQLEITLGRVNVEDAE